jgi:hypothetical protein
MPRTIVIPSLPRHVEREAERSIFLCDYRYRYALQDQAAAASESMHRGENEKGDIMYVGL